VTVGTTRFDGLIDVVLSARFAMAVLRKGYSRVVVQVGNSALPAFAANPRTVAPPSPSDCSQWTISVAVPSTSDGSCGGTLCAVSYDLYRFKPSLAEDLGPAAFVVSHAGAGSIFEALRAGRPLVVVTNNKLADNHQLELADAMQAAGHCWACEPCTLLATIDSAKLASRTPLPPSRGALEAFASAVDRVMGFADGWGPADARG